MTAQSASDFLTSKVDSLSPSEKLFLSLLTTEPRSSEALVKAFYGRRKQPMPFNGRIVVNSLIRTLARKVAATPGARYTVARTERAGPHSISVWLQRRRG